jgi:hypothetical protein
VACPARHISSDAQYFGPATECDQEIWNPQPDEESPEATHNQPR